MENYSTTQASNLGAVAGLIVIIMGKIFHISATIEEVTLALGGAIALVSIIVNWVNRYKKGDLTPLGARLK